MTDIQAHGWPMAGGNQQTQYLRDAIIKVQRQKQRPTASRIFKAVRQCMESVTLEQVTGWLEKAVRFGELVVVDNDGVMSYREPRRNLSNLVPATQHSPATSPPETNCWSDSARRFTYEPYREFLPQNASGTCTWHFPTVQPSFESMMSFGGDRISESYDLWTKSFGAAATRTFTNEFIPAQQSFSNLSAESHLYQPVSKYARVDYDENRNQHSNNAANYAPAPLSNTDLSRTKHLHSEIGPVRTGFPVGSHREHVYQSFSHQSDCANAIPPNGDNMHNHLLTYNSVNSMSFADSHNFNNTLFDGNKDRTFEVDHRSRRTSGFVASSDKYHVDFGECNRQRGNADINLHGPVSKDRRNGHSGNLCYLESEMLLTSDQKETDEKNDINNTPITTNEIILNLPTSDAYNAENVSDKFSKEYLESKVFPVSTDGICSNSFEQMPVLSNGPEATADKNTNRNKPDIARDVSEHAECATVTDNSQITKDRESPLACSNLKVPLPEQILDCGASEDQRNVGKTLEETCEEDSSLLEAVSCNEDGCSLSSTDQEEGSISTDVEQSSQDAHCLREEIEDTFEIEVKCNEESKDVITTHPVTDVQNEPTQICSAQIPRGLVDGLSHFFTPTERRRPRPNHSIEVLPTSRRSRHHKMLNSVSVSSAVDDDTSRTNCIATTTDSIADRGLLTSTCASTSTSTSPCRRRHTNSSTSRRRREQLTDGLSHFFMAVGKRRSCIPARLRNVSTVNVDLDLSSSKRADMTSDDQLLNSLHEQVASVKLKRLSVDVTRDVALVASHNSNSDSVSLESRLFSKDTSHKHAAGLYERVMSHNDADILQSAIMYPDLVMFKQAQKTAIDRNRITEDATCFQFGGYSIDAPLTSYARLPTRYICEFCLKFVSSSTYLNRHLTICDMRRPPGDEIYCDRENNLSVYELDGSSEEPSTAVYCASLILLAQLFVGNESTITPSSSKRFYILVRRDEQHFIGCIYREMISDHFSKQLSPLSGCFVLPQHRHNGYGDFLIRFGYMLDTFTQQPVCSSLLSINSPSMQSCCARMVLNVIHKSSTKQSTLTVKDIISSTGIGMEDVVKAIRLLNLVPSEIVSIRESTAIDLGCDAVIAALDGFKPPTIELHASLLRLNLATAIQNMDDLVTSTDKQCKPAKCSNRLKRDLKRRQPQQTETLRSLAVARVKTLRLSSSHEQQEDDETTETCRPENSHQSEDEPQTSITDNDLSSHRVMLSTDDTQLVKSTPAKVSVAVQTDAYDSDDYSDDSSSSECSESESESDNNISNEKDENISDDDAELNSVVDECRESEAVKDEVCTIDRTESYIAAMESPVSVSANSTDCESESEQQQVSSSLLVDGKPVIDPVEYFDAADMTQSEDNLAFKTPEQSPVDTRFGPASVSYPPGSVISGSYGSSPSMYGAHDVCNQSSCLSVSGNVVSGYSNLPTPSPTNSSSRSFSMASPSGAYQQPASANGFQFDQSPVYMTESNRFQAAPVNGPYSACVPDTYCPPANYNYTHCVSPSSVDRPGRSCPSAPTSQRTYQNGVTWQHQQHEDVRFFPQQMETSRQLPVMIQPGVGQMHYRPTVNHFSTKPLHRRYAKNCPSAYSNGSRLAPNVTIQPGTNVITGYYDTSHPAYRKSTTNSMNLTGASVRHDSLSSSFDYPAGYSYEQTGSMRTKSNYSQQYTGSHSHVDQQYHHGIYPNMAYDTYLNGPMSSFGMR